MKLYMLDNGSYKLIIRIQIVLFNSIKYVY